jgi:hypothetical protein
MVETMFGSGALTYCDRKVGGDAIDFWRVGGLGETSEELCVHGPGTEYRLTPGGEQVETTCSFQDLREFGMT